SSLFACMYLFRLSPHFYIVIFFLQETTTTEIYTLSLHDALPIFGERDSIGQEIKFILVSALALTVWDLFLDPQMVAWGFWIWERSEERRVGKECRWPW